MIIQAITRQELVKIAKASVAASDPRMISFVNLLIGSGQYTEATEDEIEMLDNLLFDLED